MNDEVDERISAWHEIAAHPYFAPAFEGDGALLPKMVAMLDALTERTVAAETTQADEPVDERIARAFANGYREGMERSVRGRLDAW